LKIGNWELRKKDFHYIAVAIKVRTFFNGSNEHVSEINFLPCALCLLPSAVKVEINCLGVDKTAITIQENGNVFLN
jgi:hypothetical protein